MSEQETFGMQSVKRGDRCSNDNRDDWWTTPCCFEDIEHQDTTKCPKCGAPIVCTVEQIPSSVCTIADADEEEG